MCFVYFFGQIHCPQITVRRWREGLLPEGEAVVSFNFNVMWRKRKLNSAKWIIKITFLQGFRVDLGHPTCKEVNLNQNYLNFNIWQKSRATILAIIISVCSPFQCIGISVPCQHNFLEAL